MENVIYTKKEKIYVDGELRFASSTFIWDDDDDERLPWEDEPETKNEPVKETPKETSEENTGKTLIEKATNILRKLFRV